METKLEQLRNQWLEYKRKGDTKGMKLTEIRAKLLKREFKPTFEQQVEDIFLTPNA